MAARAGWAPPEVDLMSSSTVIAPTDRNRLTRRFNLCRYNHRFTPYLTEPGH